MSASPSTSRRIDIDILRALAVLAVILFHFDVPGFDGGFLGVDMFYVISGYLITAHLFNGFTNQTFTFLQFYARRIRRLFPALCVVLFISSLISFFILPKILLQEFSHSLLATSVYGANIFFFLISDYFDTENILKPLLHTWSLAVEEQFYLFWPILIALAIRLRPILLIAIAGFLSLIAAEITLTHNATAVFYLLPFRIFEFAIGAIAVNLPKKKLSTSMEVLIFLTAFSVIIGSFLILDETSRTPGILNLPLCFSVIAIIYINSSHLTKPTLINRSLQWIGLLSYSAYLVHWPLVVFYKIQTPGPVPLGLIPVFISLTFFLAWVLYRFVEIPTQNIAIKGNIGKWFLLIPVMIGYALFYLAASPYLYQKLRGNQSLTQAKNHVDDRPEPSIEKILDAIPGRKEALKQAYSEIVSLNEVTPVTKSKKIIVLGDSHGEDMHIALQYQLAATPWRSELVHSICDPVTVNTSDAKLLDLYKSHPQDPPKNPSFCRPYHDNLITVLVSQAPDVIIFSEDWRQDTLPLMEETIREIQRTLQDVPIFILGKNVAFFPHPNIVFKRFSSVEELNQGAWNVRYSGFKKRDNELSKIANNTGAIYISKQDDIVCPNKQCVLVIDGALTYTDQSHWSPIGLKFYGKKLTQHPKLEQILRIAE